MTLPEATDSPCRDCPWRRNAARGWLGPWTAEQWEQLAHSDEPIACHLSVKESDSWDGALQCRGAASYRANAAKNPRDPSVVVGPRDPDVFGFGEFRTYHEADR